MTAAQRAGSTGSPHRSSSTVGTSRSMKAVIEAIATLDDKLSGQIQGVFTGLSELTEAHHRAVLEQERRNATFATAVRLDNLDNKISGFMQESGGRIAQFHALQAPAASRYLQGANQLTGWLVQALLILTSTILGFILYHAVFH